MAGPTALVHSAVSLALISLVLSSCTMGTEEVVDEPAETVEEVAPEETAPADLRFVAPANCTELLPDQALASLEASGVSLVRGPGSPSEEGIYPEGQTPEELIGGLSCLFAVPGEEDSGLTIILSAAAVDPSVRPQIIDDFITEGLNTGLTADGSGLTYWRWGDDVNVTALHNALYQDSWYSALIQPGGRSAYDQGVALVDAMRQHTAR